MIYASVCRRRNGRQEITVSKDLVNVKRLRVNNDCLCIRANYVNHLFTRKCYRQCTIHAVNNVLIISARLRLLSLWNKKKSVICNSLTLHSVSLYKVTDNRWYKRRTNDTSTLVRFASIILFLPKTDSCVAYINYYARLESQLEYGTISPAKTAAEVINSCYTQ